MSLLLNEEQSMLRESALAFLSERSPVSAMRSLLGAEHAAPGIDLWPDMVELGWTAAALPEAHGGLGLGWAGMAALFEQMGRHLCTSALLHRAVLPGELIQRLGSEEQKANWLARIAAGDARIAVALEESARHDPHRVSLRATARAEGGWTLQGRKPLVWDVTGAEVLLVLARTAEAEASSGGLSLFFVPANAPGLSVRSLKSVDGHPAGSLHLESLRVNADALLGELNGAAPGLDASLDRARLCVAAELLGVIQEAFVRTLDYLRQRIQFGVPIGSFQALQHRAARLHSEIEMLRSCVAAAAEAFDADAADSATLVSLAKARASDLSEKALNEAVQMHGGIGVTHEFDIGLFLKRGRVLQQMYGDGVFHRDRYAVLKGF